MPDALEGVRILDLTQGLAGPFATKLLADEGADVVKVERPGGGDPMRRAGPFPGDRPDSEKSGLFLYLNTSKRGIVLDLADPDDASRLRELAARSDVLVESFRPGTLERLGFGVARLREINPALGVVSLSNFGQTGPYRDWELTELPSFALSGPMYQTGLPGREPLGFAERATLSFAGLALAGAILAAVLTGRRTGRGPRVELGIAESFLAGGERQPLSYHYCRDVPQRVGDPLREQFLMGAYRCGDGYVAVQGIGRGESWWPRVFRMMGQPELSRDPRFRDSQTIVQNKAEFDGLWQRWLMDHTRAEIFDAAAEARFPIAPVYTAEDIHRDPHFVERGIFAEVDHPVAGRLALPTRPFRLHGAPSRPPRPAPLLDQHGAEVRAELEAPAPPRRPRPNRASGAPLPLAGLRVVEIAEGWAGPMTGMWLGDLGAEVIKVEAIQRFDHSRGPIQVPEGQGTYPDRKPGPRPYDVHSPYVQANRNKLGITLDLSRPRGVELFKQLVAVSNVVVTNMVTGVPEKMGIGYGELVRVRPDLVMLTCSGYGASGPYSRRVTMGGAMDGIAGYTWLRHYPDQTPDTANYSMHTDVVTSLNNAIAVLMAVHQHRESRAGQLVEVSGVEACLHQIPEALMDYAMNGRVHGARGNGHGAMAPHGVYPCRGEDRWIAIAVRDDERWSSLVRLMGDPAWARETRFDTAAGRREHAAELDRRLSAWTGERDSGELMHQLQTARIAAGAVQDAAEHAADPHWRARGLYQTTRLGSYGEYPLLASPWVVDGERLGIRHPPPSLGEHNRQVLSELLDLSDATLAKLAADGIIGDEPVPHEL